MATYTPAQGTQPPSAMRDMREQALSLLFPRPHTPYSAVSPATPLSAPRPPAPVTSSWTPGLHTSPVGPPTDVDVKVAELTASLVAASDVERRQLDTIQRLAAQLEKTERAERAHRLGSPVTPYGRPHSKDAQTPRRKSTVRTGLAARTARGRPAKREERSSYNGAAKAQEMDTNTTAMQTTSRPAHRRNGGEADVRQARPATLQEIEDLRRQVEQLQRREVARQPDRVQTNVDLHSIPTSNELARALADVRETAASLAAERQQLIDSVHQLRAEGSPSVKNMTNAKPEAPRRLQAAIQLQATAPKTSRKRISFEPSPGEEPAGFDSESHDEFGSPPRGPPLDAPIAASGREDANTAATSLEEDLRKELRSVLNENAVLSARVAQLEGQQSSPSAEVMHRLQAEVDVLCSVADCLRLGDADGTTFPQVTETLTIATRASTASMGMSGQNGRGGVDVENPWGRLETLVSRIGNARRSIAVKYGAWLEQEALEASKQAEARVESSCDHNANDSLELSANGMSDESSMSWLKEIRDM